MSPYWDSLKITKLEFLSLKRVLTDTSLSENGLKVTLKRQNIGSVNNCKSIFPKEAMLRKRKYRTFDEMKKDKDKKNQEQM